MRGTESTGRRCEKRYRWHSERNTAQMGVEDSTHLTKGCRVSDSALGIVLKATWLV
jgi:hypothetical protein